MMPCMYRAMAGSVDTRASQLADLAYPAFICE